VVKRRVCRRPLQLPTLCCLVVMYARCLSATLRGQSLLFSPWSLQLPAPASRSGTQRRAPSRRTSARTTAPRRSSLCQWDRLSWSMTLTCRYAGSASPLNAPPSANSKNRRRRSGGNAAFLRRAVVDPRLQPQRWRPVLRGSGRPQVARLLQPCNPSRPHQRARPSRLTLRVAPWATWSRANSSARRRPSAWRRR